ncbi:MAG: CbtB-domain containing protein [Acidimicrobiaceae bacterium]|nr:CbtB-domain containing protein [Acidimicrobiaceae bacterium]MXZ98994.1 CbtB-domain containing protein [Acidimicrobiaceae bacterium]MYE76010.1 CbtB-domain containing protein [Acidimicrobiaceae bacterium]MYE97411.1 CbtB-domain containing protein [Acidimicrobiaceae bacterium]MYH44719.1 CbtB-domain containing protein [Acidimicrobiaceae bacterium]
MESRALPAPSAPAIAEIDIPIWAWALVALAAVVSYFVMLENGVVLSHVAETLHEFFHDGRHFAGVPCH